jgi:malate dehydrogenase
MAPQRVRRRQVTIIGAGNVGAAVAQRILEAGLADVVLVDIVPGLAQGKALDLAEAGPLLGHDVSVFGTTSFLDTADSSVVVVTAGRARHPGMSRDDLLPQNAQIVNAVVEQAAKHSPGAVLVVVTDPLDAMCHVALKASGFPRQRVIGMAGVLDAARFRTFLSLELGVSPANTTAFVLGGHGDAMVPIPRYSTVGGVPITQLLSGEAIDRLVARTRAGGAEIVSLLKTGSAYHAPAAAAAEIVDSILEDRHKILPCSAYLTGEYGVNDLFIGVPVRLSRAGVDEIVEVELTDDEHAAFQASVESVRRLVTALGTFA